MKKRFSKKALSLFLAVMMIITAVPAFSLTVSAAATGTEAEKKAIIDTLEEDATTKTPESATATAYHYADVATNGYSNVLYAISGNTYKTDEINKNYAKTIIYYPKSITLMYDGVNEASLPIQFGYKKNGNSSRTCLGIYSNGTTLTFTQYWIGFTDEGSSGDTGKGSNASQLWVGNYTADSNTAEIFNYTSTDTTTKTYKVTNSTRRFAYNKLVYQGTGNTENYYETISLPSITVNANDDDEKATHSPSGTVYVLNYKPIYDYLKSDSDYHSLIEKVKENYWKYTKDSLSSYVSAVNAITNFKLSDYFDTSTSTSKNDYEGAAAKIKELVTNYEAVTLTLDTFTVTIKDGSTDTTVSTGTITAGNTIGSNTDIAIPTVGHDSSTHYTTTWSTDVPEKDTVPHEDVTYAYTTADPAFTYDSSDKQFECSYSSCGSQISDASAYNAAAEKYATIDKSAYTSDGQTAITSAYSDFEAIKSNTYTTEDDVTSALNTQTANLLNAIGDQDANKNTFTLTVNTYADSTSTTSSTTGAEKHTYGYTESITIPSNAVSVKVTRADGSKSGSSSTYIDFTPGKEYTYTVKVQSDTVVDIYTADSASYVLLEDYAGRAQVIFTKAETATISDRTVTIDGTEYTTPSAGYVTFGGYTVDGTKATGSVNISNGSVIKAYGTKDANTVTYEVTGGTINNEEKLTAKVDTSLTVTGNTGTAAIAIKDDNGYTVLTYGNTLTFFGFPQAAVGDTVEIVCVDADDLSKYGLSDKMPMSYGVGYASDSNTFSMYCMMSTGFNTDAAIIERGVLVSATVSESDSLIKGADNVKTLKSSSDIDSQSYMATIKTSTSTSTIYARSYVAYTLKYENDGTTYYLPVVAYGEVQTLTAA